MRCLVSRADPLEFAGQLGMLCTMAETSTPRDAMGTLLSSDSCFLSSFAQDLAEKNRDADADRDHE